MVKMVQQLFWGQKLTKWCNFWAQKLTLWASDPLCFKYLTFTPISLFQLQTRSENSMLFAQFWRFAVATHIPRLTFVILII